MLETGDTDESAGPDEALYARMRWNMPLSPEHAGLLLDRLDLRPGQRIADLGCGWGELLLSAVGRAGAGTSGIGIDDDASVLERGRREALRRGLPAEFVRADAAAWRGAADRVLCTGAAHAFGGTGDALRALADVVPPGGRLLYGDGFWSRSPAPEAVGLLGEGIGSLTDLLEAARAAGWRVIHVSEADQREWDDFESTFRAGRQEWLLDHEDHPRAAEIREWLDGREREYVTVYRGILGFAYLILAH
ncbi:MAG: methyltransferase domain-containing protein [Nocardiopsaceae bacterium]|nr:methyltransferase domain-containing protein [Nocardiopsaceae bacterium]